MTNNDASGVGKLGLPETGPGSPAGWGRRFAALFVDWVIANLVAYFVSGGTLPWDTERAVAWLPLACWFVLVWFSTGFTGASLGQHLLRLRVIRLDRQRVGLPVGGIRTALIVLVIPPLVFTREGRGLHDLAVGTIVVNGPREGAA